MKKHILIVILLSLFSINAMQEQNFYEIKKTTGKITIAQIKQPALMQFDWYPELPKI